VDRQLFEEDHLLFRDSVRRFVDREIVPHHDEWERAGITDRDLFRSAGAAGLIGMAVPEGYGGGGVDDFRYHAVISEELCRAGVLPSGTGIALENDVCLPYFLDFADEEQKRRWLPGICAGDLVTAVAMTEPGTGSDLASMATVARHDGDGYVLDGAKTFITNGLHSDLVIVACKTDPAARHRGISLLVVERGMDGFDRGRNLDKVGQHAQDTAELFFSGVRVPVANRLGAEGAGFRYLCTKLAQERLSIAVAALAHANAAFDWTLEYVRHRHAFGQPIGTFQHNRFTMAELRTELDIGQVAVDQQILLRNAGALTPEDAAKTKWWCSELNKRVLDACLQLHGGYGYMEEYPVARAWRDGRVMSIYGGTTEIMKELIGRSLGL